MGGAAGLADGPCVPDHEQGGEAPATPVRVHPRPFLVHHTADGGTRRARVVRRRPGPLRGLRHDGQDHVFVGLPALGLRRARRLPAIGAAGSGASRADPGGERQRPLRARADPRNGIRTGAMNIRPELRDATAATIEDAVAHADPMALRGLLYQLTGDETIAATEVELVRAGNSEAMALARREVPALRA